jgi:hypothetical protein
MACHVRTPLTIMATTTDDFAIPLVQGAPADAEVGARSPGATASLVGVPAGALALALVHGLNTTAHEAVFDRAASVRGVPFAAACALAYVTAGAIGGLVGTAFGHVTRFLTKWPALAVWGVIFFTSLMMVLLAAYTVYRGPVALAGPIIAAGALYGGLLSFSLPFRRRS